MCDYNKALIKFYDNYYANLKISLQYKDNFFIANMNKFIIELKLNYAIECRDLIPKLHDSIDSWVNELASDYCEELNGGIYIDIPIFSLNDLPFMDNNTWLDGLYNTMKLVYSDISYL